MTQATHTPAPWDYSPSLHTFDDGAKVPTYAIQNIDGDFIAKLHPFNGLPHESAEVFANARLIAASPTLYEYAMKQALNGCDEAKAILKGL